MKHRQYILGPALSYFTIFFNIIAGLIYTPWMVRQIGQSNYALYTLAGSFISIFMMDFGLSAAVSRYIAKYRAEGNDKKADEFMGIVTKLYLLIDAVIFLALLCVYFFLDSIYVGLTPEELQTYKLLYIIVASYSIFSFPFTPMSGILNAYERFIELKLCDLISKILTIALVVFALIRGLGVVAVVTANAFSGLIIILIKLYLIRRKTAVRLELSCRDKGLFREIFAFSIWTTVMSLAQRCIFNLAPTFLGIFSNSKEIALFAPASTLEGYFYTIAAAVNGIFLAKISKYIADGEENRINRLMNLIGKYQLVLLGLIFAGFVCIGKEFMSLWMGNDYVGAWPCAILLFIPDYLNYTQQIANTMATAKNKVREVAIGHILMATVSVLLSALLCGKLGALGSAIAITAAYSVLLVFLNVYVYTKKLGLDMRSFYKECYGRLLPPIVAATAVGFGVCRVMPTADGWIDLILKGVCVTAIYVAFVLSFGVKLQEIKDLCRKLKNRART